MNMKKILSATLAAMQVFAVPVLLALAFPVSAGPGERNFVVTEKVYPLPDVTLVDSAGEPVRFSEITGDAKRTIVSFIFTSCAGICPMITSNMARAVPKLDEMDDDYQILLISVDPEFDTPARLTAYAERFKTGPKIRFLTGDGDKVFRVVRSFEALYEGSNKMNHQPVTLISRGRPGRWTRIDGLIGSEVLVQQYRKLIDRQTG